MIDEKRIAEVVRILRKYGAGDALLHHYEVQPLAKVAADLIESLQSQLAGCRADISMFHAELGGVSMDNIRLQDALAASQAREKAAVEELKEAAIKSGRLCVWCKFRGDLQHCVSCGWGAGWVENDWKKDLFEWRGVQEEHNG